MVQTSCAETPDYLSNIGRCLDIICN